MASVGFHPDAQAEYRSALGWYGQGNRRAAVRFERAVDRVLSRIAADPLTYPLLDDRHREAILTRYPYSVIYRIESSGFCRRQPCGSCQR